jgi:hypothetical protein
MGIRRLIDRIRYYLTRKRALWARLRILCKSEKLRLREIPGNGSTIAQELYRQFCSCGAELKLRFKWLNELASAGEPRTTLGCGERIISLVELERIKDSAEGREKALTTKLSDLEYRLSVYHGAFVIGLGESGPDFSKPRGHEFSDDDEDSSDVEDLQEIARQQLRDKIIFLSSLQSQTEFKLSQTESELKVECEAVVKLQSALKTLINSVVQQHKISPVSPEVVSSVAAAKRLLPKSKPKAKTSTECKGDDPWLSPYAKYAPHREACKSWSKLLDGLATFPGCSKLLVEFLFTFNVKTFTVPPEGCYYRTRDFPVTNWLWANLALHRFNRCFYVGRLSLLPAHDIWMHSPSANKLFTRARQIILPDEVVVTNCYVGPEEIEAKAVDNPGLSVIGPPVGPDGLYESPQDDPVVILNPDSSYILAIYGKTSVDYNPCYCRSCDLAD